MESALTPEEEEEWKQYATRMADEIEKNPIPSLKDLEFLEYVKNGCVGNYSDVLLNSDVKAADFFELSSITIRRPSKQLKGGVELYGDIHLVDEYDDEYAVFYHQRSDAQLFSVDDDDNLLTISLRDCKLNRPHLLPKHFWVYMCLKDRCRNITIIKNKFRLDFAGKPRFNEQQCLNIPTQGDGVVSLHYTILQYGVAARVNCKIQKKNEASILRENGQYPRVKGIISAVVDRKLGENDGFSRVLFDKDCVIPSIFDPPDQQWQTPWFAVPSLGIGVDLDIDGEKFETDKSNFEKFEASDNVASKIETKIQGKNWHILVTVRFCQAFDFSPLYDIPGFDPEGAFKREVDKKEDDVNAHSHIKRYIYPMQLVEIFSISVHPDEHIIKDGTEAHLPLSGVIQSRDSVGSYKIFNKDRRTPYLLKSNGALSLVHPSNCHLGTGFGMRLDLDDSHHEISRGYIAWDGYAPDMYGKRVCSVVPGDFGFVAVHYTIFKRAIQATVNVSIKNWDIPRLQVYGRIYARYGSYRYITHCEKKNYQSVLFEKCKKDSVKLGKNGNLPLSKVAVAVPKDDSLIVIADLLVYVPGLEKHFIRAKATFKSGCDLEKQIVRSSSTLTIRVNWGCQAYR